MMKQNRFKIFLPVVLLFIIVNAFSISGFGKAEEWNLDNTVVGIGNIILFLVTFIALIISEKNLRSKNPNAFVRAMYVSIMLKLFICIAAAFVYIAMYGKNINKPALFTCMGLYLVYTFLEVSILTKMLKQKSNA